MPNRCVLATHLDTGFDTTVLGTASCGVVAGNWLGFTVTNSFYAVRTKTENGVRALGPGFSTVLRQKAFEFGLTTVSEMASNLSADPRVLIYEVANLT